MCSGYTIFTNKTSHCCKVRAHFLFSSTSSEETEEILFRLFIFGRGVRRVVYSSTSRPLLFQLFSAMFFLLSSS